jgi:Zn-dependent peptidase ImmA (M78 family)
MSINIGNLAERLSNIRKALEYSVEEVAEITGLAIDRINLIEKATEKPTGDEVLILASIYQCDFRSLIDDRLPPPNSQTEILFRRFGDSLKVSDRRAIQDFLHLCQMEASMERLLQTRKIEFSYEPTGTYYKEHGLKAANALRSKLAHKDNEVKRDIYSDFRSIGIHIFRRRLSNIEISGLYIKDSSAGHCVLINYDEDIYRQRFSVSHEVAHSIFDSSQEAMVTFEKQSTKYDNADLKEIRANSFASNYLMPESVLKKISPINESNAAHWAQELRVSTAALAKALKDAKLIDPNFAPQISQVRNNAFKIDPEAPENLTESQRTRRLALLERGLSDYFVNLCFEAHYKRLISTGRLIEVLHVDHSELADVAMLFGRTITHGD